MAVKGAELLKSMNISGLLLFFLIAFLSLFMDMFITSNSAKWVMFAPFLVPMMAMLDVSPNDSDSISYRDSCGNMISPVELNVPIALGLMETYKVRKTDKAGIGSLISMNLPFTIVYFITFFLMIILWYVLDLPLGPEQVLC